MNVIELSQIVNHPDEESVEFVELMRRAGDRVPDPSPSPLTIIKLNLGRWLHWAGLHTWVRMLTYDQPSDRVLDTGKLICVFCTQAKLR